MPEGLVDQDARHVVVNDGGHAARGGAVGVQQVLQGTGGFLHPRHWIALPDDLETAHATYALAEGGHGAVLLSGEVGDHQDP